MAKILYLSHRIPYPPNKGDKIRSFNEIKCLSTSHEVHLACMADNLADLRYESYLKKYCKKVCVVPLKASSARVKSLASLIYNRPLSVGYFYSNSLQTTINLWFSANSYDAVICFSSPMAEYLFSSPFLGCRFSNRRHTHQKPETRNQQLIMDFVDVDSDKWAQYAQLSTFPLSLIYKIESKRLLKYEKRINQFFDHSVFVSRKEADLFSKLCPEARNISVIPNGVDYKYFSPYQATSIQQPETSIQHPILLFTGAMDYHANVDGVTWFCNNIFPMVKRDFPEAQFYIVGSNPHPKVRDLGHRSGIKVTGFVEDIRPYYQAADVCVIPLRLARGIQNKVLEAMAMGKAVVSTAKGIEGIMAVPEKHLLVEDTPQDFSNALTRLLKDQQAKKQLGARARAFVMKKYDWPNNIKKIEVLLNV